MNVHSHWLNLTRNSASKTVHVCSGNVKKNPTRLGSVLWTYPTWAVLSKCPWTTFPLTNGTGFVHALSSQWERTQNRERVHSLIPIPGVFSPYGTQTQTHLLALASASSTISLFILFNPFPSPPCFPYFPLHFVYVYSLSFRECTPVFFWQLLQIGISRSLFAIICNGPLVYLLYLFWREQNIVLPSLRFPLQYRVKHNTLVDFLTEKRSASSSSDRGTSSCRLDHSM